MSETLRKPEWLKIQFRTGDGYKKTRENIIGNKLHTVCEEAACPNIYECWEAGVATIMILGDVCTRACGFCNVKTGKPPVYDTDEPKRAAKSVRQMKLNHVVITSVNRDERPDGGAAIWAETINEIRKLNPQTSIEVLTPDFKGVEKDIQTVLDARPDIFAQNLETVLSQTKRVRPQAKYDRTLNVLKYASSQKATTKTGIMVGLGETFDEVLETMKDAAAANVHIFTIGQYLQPTKRHLPVSRYVTPEEFKTYHTLGMQMGFSHVESGPLVRTSYHADQQVKLAKSLQSQ